MVALCAALGAAFVAAAVAVLRRGHVHEDAYILFQYARNLAAGNGIVFDRASGPAEGATDFLWMCVLAGMRWAGLDLGTAAALLNGLGLAVIAYVVCALRPRFDALCVPAILLVAVSGGTAASLGGFSALAFGAVFLLLLHAASRRRYPAAVALALALALFRPDGVLLAAGTLLATLATATGGERKALYKMIAVAAAMGGLYMLWRSWYFGLWLPLPLLVKSSTDRVLEGLEPNIDAIAEYLPLLIALPLLFRQGAQWALVRRDLAIVLCGPALLLAALSFAHQSQNVGHRFQYPAVLAIVCLALISVRHHRAVWWFVAAALALSAPALREGVRTIRQEARYLTNDDYINALPQYLRAGGFAAGNIALTEAGRFPYWFDAVRMTDLTGLNTVSVIREGPAAALARLQPELLFVHHAGMYDVSALAAAGAFVVIDAAAVRTVGSYAGRNPVYIAPQAALDYARQRGFAAVFVRYGRRDTEFYHVYFLSPALDRERFLRALQKSHETRISYDESESAARVAILRE